MINIKFISSDFLILPDKDNNSFYMQQPELILSDRDICKLQCFGNITSGDSIEEANTTARIVRGDEHFEKYVYLIYLCTIKQWIYIYAYFIWMYN